MPKLADAQVWASTIVARKLIGPNKQLRVLIDSPVRAHAVTHEEGWIDTGVTMWGGVHPINTGYVARIPVHSVENSSDDYEDICHLTSLIGLVRSGHMQFLTSAELIAEQERQPSRRFRTTGYSDFSLLDLVQIESVDGELQDFVIRAKLFGDAGVDLAAEQRRRIASQNDHIYRSILQVFGSEKHSQDAWHLRTAQVCECDYFLTMDRKLFRMFQQHHDPLLRAGITCQIVTPAKLGRELRVRKVHPFMFSYHNASFPVRADLHMPGEKRRPSKPKKNS